MTIINKQGYLCRDHRPGVRNFWLPKYRYSGRQPYLYVGLGEVKIPKKLKGKRIYFKVEVEKVKR